MVRTFGSGITKVDEVICNQVSSSRLAGRGTRHEAQEGEFPRTLSEGRNFRSKVIRPN